MNHKRRIIHAICFEIGALALLIAILSPLFNHSIAKIGVMGITLSLITVGLLYFYNLLFDRVLFKNTGSTKKSGKARVIHALLFETTLVLAFLPLIIWWLDISLLEALILEATGVTFMVVYTFVFHWFVERFVYKQTHQN